MKIVSTTTFKLAVLAALATRSFVWASPDPFRLSRVDHGSQLEVRGEFMDYAVENLLKRSLEEELEERGAYDHDLDLDALDLEDAIVNYLYARAARRGKAALDAFRNLRDTAAGDLIGHLHQAVTQQRPRTGGISRSRSRPTSRSGRGGGRINAPGAARRTLPSRSRSRSRSKSPAGSNVASQLGPNQFQKDAASAAAQKGANAIIAKQKKDAARAAAQKGANAIIAKQKAVANGKVG